MQQLASFYPVPASGRGRSCLIHHAISGDMGSIKSLDSEWYVPASLLKKPPPRAWATFIECGDALKHAKHLLSEERFMRSSAHRRNAQTVGLLAALGRYFIYASSVAGSCLTTIRCG